MAKRLTWEDMKSREELLEERRNYTDEDAQKFGYPSAEVLRLSDTLTELAGEWRETKDENVAIRYRETLLKMILKGFDFNNLDTEDYLPEEHMPDLPPKPIQKAIIEAYKEMVIN